MDKTSAKKQPLKQVPSCNCFSTISSGMVRLKLGISAHRCPQWRVSKKTRRQVGSHLRAGKILAPFLPEWCDWKSGTIKEQNSQLNLHRNNYWAICNNCSGEIVLRFHSVLRSRTRRAICFARLNWRWLQRSSLPDVNFGANSCRFSSGQCSL